MWLGINSRGIDLNPKEFNRFYLSLYYVFFIVFASFLLMNLFIGVVMESFNA